ncbi:MAG TPA: hypothetical protein VGH44_05695 [Candidatus Saccharimonadia bacterium]
MTSALKSGVTIDVAVADELLLLASRIPDDNASYISDNVKLALERAAGAVRSDEFDAATRILDQVSCWRPVGGEVSDAAVTAIKVAVMIVGLLPHMQTV